MSFVQRLSRFLVFCLLFLCGSAAALCAGDPENPGILEISDPSKYSSVVAISDAHAHHSNVETLLRAYDIIDDAGNWAGGNTLFVVVGDSISKGKKSVELLDTWIRLQEEAELAGGRLVHTLGNHEARLLAGDKKYLKSHKEFRKNLEKNDLTAEHFLNRSTKRGKFLHAMPAGLRVGNVLYLHAGHVPDMEWGEFVRAARNDLRAGRYDSELLLGPDSVLDDRRWSKKAKRIKENAARMDKMGLSSVVFGHDSNAFGKETVAEVASLEVVPTEHGPAPKMFIKIDTGMQHGKNSSAGRLLAFDQPTQMMEETPPESIQFSSRKMTKWKSLESCEKLYVKSY